MDPSELDKAVTARIPTRTKRRRPLFHRPLPGDAARRLHAMFENMLDHPNITLALATDYRDRQRRAICTTLVYTGPIDEYLRLPLRQAAVPLARFPARDARSGMVSAGGGGQLPSEDVPYTRITEYKHLTGQRHRKTSDFLRIPVLGRRSVLSGAEPGKRRTIPALSRPRRRYCPTSSSSGGSAAIAITTWIRWSAQALSLYARLYGGAPGDAAGDRDRILQAPVRVSVLSRSGGLRSRDRRRCRAAGSPAFRRDGPVRPYRPHCRAGCPRR